jgi:hypothetical protein
VRAEWGKSIALKTRACIARSPSKCSRPTSPRRIVSVAQAHERGYRDYGFLERDPILAELRTTSRFGDILDRMRKDVDAQRARAEERGLFEVDSLLAPAR